MYSVPRTCTLILNAKHDIGAVMVCARFVFRGRTNKSALRCVLPYGDRHFCFFAHDFASGFNVHPPCTFTSEKN